MTVSSNALIKHQNEVTDSQSLTGIILISLTLVLPIIGCLSDSYLGRYKVARYSTWIMWISMIVLAVWYILDEYYVVGEY